MATPKKYEHINFTPPSGVAKAAEKGLEMRSKASPSNRGGLTPSQASEHGIGSGVQRAVNLKNRNTVSPKVVKQMKAFFARHEKNKGIKAENKGTPWNDKGYVAWLLWGGDPGKSWSEKIVGQMEKADEKEKSQKKKASDNVPNNAKLWEKVIKLTKGELKSLSGNGKTVKTPNADNPDKADGFTKYPSAYANGWASKVYADLGGTWSKKKEKKAVSHQRVAHRYLVAKGKAKKDVGHGGLDEWFSGHGQGKSKQDGSATWGDWVAISPVKRTITKEDGSKKTYEPGDIIGPCGTVSDDDDWKDLTNNGKSPFKCMARPKAHKMTKKERADLAKGKQKAEKGNNTQKPTNTPTFKKNKKAMVQKRVFYSPKPFEGFRNVGQDRKPTWKKPRGLWYSCGNSWKDFASNEMRGGMGKYSHMYEIEINPSKMLIIKDSKSFLAFEREFAISDPMGFDDDKIDWYRVAQKYDGIEICPYLGQFRMDHFWYYSWDVASGCIWGSGAIKKVRELPLNTKLAEDTMKSLIERVASRHLLATRGGHFIDRSTSPSTMYITDGNTAIKLETKGKYKGKFVPCMMNEMPVGMKALPSEKDWRGIIVSGNAVSEIASILRDPNYEVVAPAVSEIKNITFSKPFDPKEEWNMAIGIPQAHGEPTGIPSIDKKGATRNKFQIHHRSYSDAMQEAYDYANANGYEMIEDNVFQQVTTGRGKPSVGETRKHSLLLMKNGKIQRKALQVQVYGMESGTYELNVYIM